MVASWTLLVMSFWSCIVHADLWLVYRKQMHLFQPLLALIPTKQRKEYQGAYRNSLKRRFYCVQDKVDVSGTTFTACFTGIYGLLFFLNLFSSETYIDVFSFWLQGMSYYVFMLFCLATFRDQRELCFYCKYELSQGALHCLLGFFLMTENWQWLFPIVLIAIFVCVVFVRQAQKEDREDQRLAQMERAQYEQQAYADDTTTTADDDIDNSNKNNASMAYKQKVEDSNTDHHQQNGAYIRRLSHKDKKQNELLTEIQEAEDCKESEEPIEEIDCPGIDGASKNFAGFPHRAAANTRQQRARR